MIKIQVRELLLSLILVVAGVTAAGAVTPVVRQPAGQTGIIVGTAHQNPRGIIVGTAHFLRERPVHNPSAEIDKKGRLLLGIPDGRAMLLPDGVYTSKNGVQMRFRGGRIMAVEPGAKR